MQKIHRSHSAQNHRSIEQGIQPFQLSQVVVTDNSNSQGQGEDNKGEHPMASDALCKIGTTEDRVLSMFVHTRLPPIMSQLSGRRGRLDAAKTPEQSEHRSSRKSIATYSILFLPQWSTT